MIIDAVASGAAQTSIFDALRADGPKEYAEVATGAQFQVPEGIKRHVVFGRTVFEKPGGANIMPAFSELVSEGKYKIPVQLKNVGSGFEAIGEGVGGVEGGCEWDHISSDALRCLVSLVKVTTGLLHLSTRCTYLSLTLLQKTQAVIEFMIKYIVLVVFNAFFVPRHRRSSSPGPQLHTFAVPDPPAKVVTESQVRSHS